MFGGHYQTTMNSRNFRISLLFLSIILCFCSNTLSAQCDQNIVLSNSIINAPQAAETIIGRLTYACPSVAPNDISFRIKTGLLNLDILNQFKIVENALVGRASFLCVRSFYHLEIEAVNRNTGRVLQRNRFRLEINCPPTRVILTPSTLSLDGKPHVKENEPLKTRIGFLSAIDFDSSPQQIRYSIVEDAEGDHRFFKIENNELYTMHSFDYEHAPPNLQHQIIPNKTSYFLTIRAEDQGQQGTSRTFEVVVDDVSGKYDANGRADAEVAQYYNVEEGDFLVLNRFGNGNNILYNIANPGNASQRIRVDQGKAIRIKGDYYQRIAFNLNEVSTTQKPVTVTNFLGQVNTQQLQIYNGSDYRITGQYSASNKTGDPFFKGCQWQGGTTDFGYSAGKYGIAIQNYNWEQALNNASNLPQLLEIGKRFDSDPTAMPSQNVEIDHLEISGAGFAGIRATRNNGSGAMNNLYIHHNYIHDVFSEGLYLSETSDNNTPGTPFTLKNLLVENNLIVRTGSEAIQADYAQDNCRIKNNVAWGGTAWLKPFKAFQDNVLQLAAVDGNNSVENNILLGGGEKFVLLQVKEYAGYQASGGDITVNNNLLHSSPGRYAIDIHAFNNGITDYVISNNFMGKIDFEYSRGGGGIPSDAPINIAPKDQPNVDATLINNVYDLTGTAFNSAFNYRSGGNIAVADINNKAEMVMKPFFENALGSVTTEYRKWHRWNSSIAFLVGEIVLSPDAFGNIRYFQCISGNLGQKPNLNPGLWQLLTWEHPNSTNIFLPPDDFNLVGGSFYQQKNIGLNP